MKRKNTKIGDIFSVRIDESNQKFLQYVTNDLTQLNSDIIRVFKRIYPIGTLIDFTEVVKGDVDFYAHCVTKWGIEMGCWEQVGNINDVGDFTHVLFRDSDDYGEPEVKISQRWWVWKINQKQIFVGKLKGKYQEAEIGVVINPKSIVRRIKSGDYGDFFPGF